MGVFALRTLPLVYLALLLLVFLSKYVSLDKYLDMV